MHRSMPLNTYLGGSHLKQTQTLVDLIELRVEYGSRVILFAFILELYFLFVHCIVEL